MQSIQNPIAKTFIKTVLLGSLLAAANGLAAEKPVLNDWFALGSGCKAKADLPGNVKMESLPQDPARPNVHRVKFSFSGFELAGDTAPKEVEQFARECAVRININPSKTQKIVDVRAQTAVVASKDLGASLDINSELKIGSSSLGAVRKTMASTAKVDLTEEKIELSSDGAKGNTLPTLGCGEGKIIGFDFSWIAKRERKKITNLSVGLSKEKSLIIEATIGDCKI
ncbi:MAG: hypothetical protein NT027_13755 [Proteobacteria bacterium]|nr:hypothetical protein [Pseudomonadota bacterium]